MTAHTTAMTPERKRVGTLVLFGWDERWIQSMGDPPAPSAGTGEDPAYLVFDRTDSITRLCLPPLLTPPATELATVGRMSEASVRSQSR